MIDEKPLFSASSLTAMIVDDHDPIRKAIKRIIVNMGFGEILECFDGNDALKLLAKKPVDLLITDLFMRQVSGFRLLEHIRNRDVGADIPVIVVTGEASKEEIVRVADMGAEDYVLKPFQPEDLERKVIKVLNKFYSPPPLLKILRKAERLVLAHQYDAAIAAYDEALSLDPESSRAAHGKSVVLSTTGKAEEAVALLSASIEKNHSYHKAHAAMADILLKMGRNAEAIESLRLELSINPKQGSRQIHLARLLLKEGDAVSAIEHFKHALKEDPKRLAALMGIGQAYAAADNLDKALGYFKRVRRYHPNHTKALESTIRAAIAANEPKKAENFLKDERTANPTRMDVHLMLAMFYINQDRDDDALAAADELLKRDPASSQAQRIKAAVLIKKKDYAAAVTVLNEVAKVSPTAEIFTSIGEAMIGLGKPQEAMNTLHKALSLNPDSPNALFLLAEIHRKSQQWIKAYYLYRRTLRLGGDRDRCQAEIKNCMAQIDQRRRFRAAS